LGRSGIEQLLYAMDQAFDSRIRENLMGNLADVPEDLWLWTPPGGNRRIFDIVSHVGQAKYVYDNHAFGDQSIRWEKPESMPGLAEGTSPNDAIAWLREGHERLRGHVATLADDAELPGQRYAWSLAFTVETRMVITIMVQHDAYHAGEINHIRALAQDND
jgi:uncharacterized damage-inducible protein DinB